MFVCFGPRTLTNRNSFVSHTLACSVHIYFFCQLVYVF